MRPTELAPAFACNPARRVPTLRWLELVALVLILYVGAIGALEACSRSFGFQPDIPETKELWFYWRQRVYDEPRNTAVLLGTSRMQTDVSLGTLEETLHRRVVQLAISETGPIGVLHDLANDPRFCGFVICSLYVPLVHHSRWSDGLAYRTFEPRHTITYLETLCSLRLRSGFALLNPRLALSSLARGIVDLSRSGHFREPSSFALGFDRSLALFMGPSTNNVVQSRSSPVRRFSDVQIPAFEELRQDINALNLVIKRLRSRGGDVVFVQLPSTGDRDIDEENAFPKRAYWDRFARLIDARCIHFKDYASLRSFECLDGAHLSVYDRKRFTEALANELLIGRPFMRAGQIGSMRFAAMRSGGMGRAIDGRPFNLRK
jgi:hypothetical protein